MNKENIPEGTISTNDYQEYKFECSGVGNYQSLKMAKEVLSSMLDEENSILKKINVFYEAGKIFVTLNINSCVVSKINEDELLNNIQGFLKEFLSLPSIYHDSYKYDYKNNLKSLQYFFDNYSLVENGEKKVFKDILIKRKII